MSKTNDLRLSSSSTEAPPANRFLTTPDAGGSSPLQRLQAHIAGNSTSAKVLVRRDTLNALIALAESVAAPVVPPAPLEQALTALEFAHGAILDAIGLDDGLDGNAGEAVLKMIRAALVANGKTPPEFPKEDEAVEPLPIWTASLAASVATEAPQYQENAEDVTRGEALCSPLVSGPPQPPSGDK